MGYFPNYFSKVKNKKKLILSSEYLYSNTNFFSYYFLKKTVTCT